LRPEQSGWLFRLYAVLPMLAWVPLSIFLMRRIEAKIVLTIGLAAFAAAGLLGTRVTHD
jgi:DHA2 family multidrug resistance protein